MAATTAHTHGPNFGRKVDGCPRCTELINGASPVKGWGDDKRQRDDQRSREIEAHFRSYKHRNGGCDPVCTFGDP